MSFELKDYGWTEALDETMSGRLDDGARLARVVSEARGSYGLQTEEGRLDARAMGGLRHRAEGDSMLPCVGDWVTWRRGENDDMAVIESVLPRFSKLSRKVAGSRAVEQVVAANVDCVLLVMGLDGDYSPRRLERFLVMAWESGARPVVVLNKRDLCRDVEERLDEIGNIAAGVPVLALSAKEGELSDLDDLLVSGETVVVVGSSGVGKSTLINGLLGEERLATAEVREGDDRGRHTTTSRSLVVLPSGALLIDSPGIRELQLWDSAAGLEDVFDDIGQLAQACRFRDCRHDGEPGCVVVKAIEDGELDGARLRSLRGLEQEARELERRRDVRASREADRRLGKLYRNVLTEKKKTREH